MQFTRISQNRTKNYGEAFARSAAKRDGGIFKTRTWATREEATAAATTLGLQVI
jgi:hypothetical protein